MRPVNVPGGRYPRGSVWRAGGDAGRRLVLVSNETYNEISDFVQVLEIADAPERESSQILVRGPGREGTRPGHLVPRLRSVEKRHLQGLGQLASSHLGALDRCLLDMIVG